MENTKLQIIYGDVLLGLKGKNFHYLFNYEKGGPESLKINGKEWLYRVPKPTFWRATTDNDRGNRFSEKSAQWLGADLFTGCNDRKVIVDGNDLGIPNAPKNNQFSEQELADTVSLQFTFETPTTPKTNVVITYTVHSNGKIVITTTYQGKAGLPQLPCFGLRLIMPTAATGFTYQGLSGETYPDRKAGGVLGTYEVAGLPVTPYLVPQECGMHLETDQLTITRQKTQNNTDMAPIDFSLRFEKTSTPFSFSCLPYTSLELESATHQEELPLPRRTVLCIYGAVRGVGGIDSWGSDVESPYQISAEQDISFEFALVPA